MITLLRLDNFQPHRKLVLELDRITTIVGPPDRGKTAILRALYWLCFGRPLGEEFIRHGSDRCRVLAVLDGRVVAKVRGAGKGGYKLDEKVFHAVGATVPDEIRQLLNVSDVNFQGQLQPLFWFLDTPAQLSRQLNSVVDLGFIDQCQANAAGRVRSAKVRVNVCRERIEALERKVDDLAWVEGFDRYLRALEALHDRLEDARKRRQGLHLLVSRLLGARKLKMWLSGAACASAEVLRVADRLREVVVRRRRLEGLLLHHSALAAETRQNLNGIMEKVRRLENLRRNLDETQSQRRRLEQLLRRLKEQQVEHRATSARYDEESQSLRENLEGSPCPVCRRPVPSSRSSSQTSTCPTSHRRPGGRKATGTK